VPSGFFAITLIAIALPRQFGKHCPSSWSWKSFNRLDYVGSGLLLTASLLLVTALMEATIDFSWSSAVTIAMLAISGVSWTAFVLWECHVSSRDGPAEPIFPWRFLYNRAWVGMLLTSFFVGSPFNVVIVTIPQRFQVLSNSSVIEAGVRLIPFSLSAALCSALGNIICGRFRVPPVYFLLLGGVLNVVGLVCLSTIPVSPPSFPRAGYAYEAISAAGIGFTFGILVLSTPFMVPGPDLAVATGALIQFRFLGGAIGLSIASSIMNSMLKSNLKGILPPEVLEHLLNDVGFIKSLGVDVQEIVREVFAKIYRKQFQVMIGFAAVQIPATALMLKKEKQFLAA
jgi:hypothetical protein